jgi:hypothetical protein
VDTLDLKNVDMIAVIDDLIYYKGKILVIFDNGEKVELPVRKLIFHLMFWAIGRKWNITITPAFIVDTSFIYDSTISEIGSRLFDAIQAVTEGSCYNFVYDMNDAVNYLNKFITINCQEYHQTMTIVDLARIAYIPGIKAITDDRVCDIKVSIQQANEYIKKNFSLLFDELKKPYPGNKLHNFVNLRFVKATALAHIFYQIGFRTDIDDNTIRYPIQGNYLDGLRNTVEYCLESLSAKKAMFYNRDSLPTAEYFARKQHILSSCIQHLYKGDCGSTVTLPFYITENLANVVLYKNIVEGKNIITLTPNNIKHYIGKIVQCRTPIGCKYTDGVCEACAGKLISNISPNTHIGMFAAIRVASVITQVILSSKHVQETSIVEYAIPEDLKVYMMKHQGGIYVKPKIREKFKKITMIFKMNDTMQLRELGSLNIARLSTINESSFGKCKEVVLMRGNNLITEEVGLGSNDQYPLYSRELIRYIAAHQDLITIKDDMFMISLREFDFKDPIFKLVVMNNSMVKFVNNAKKLVESEIKKYTSATELVNSFSNLVYGQVKVNLAYLEIVVRAALITDKNDYRIPVIEDIDDVMFTTNPSANMLRSVGILCAFQQLPASLRNPALYLIPRTFTPFDEFLNLKPRTAGFLSVNKA